ncbi:MAG: response regulator [Candidatus Bipolaricaulia bacterium]
MIRLLLADDHRLVREGLRALLERELGPDFEVVGEAGDGRSAVELAARLKPEIAILDLAMPGMNGLEALEGIRQASPKTKVLLLSMFADEESILRAAWGGAAGFLLKASPADELLEAIRAAGSGRFYLSRGIANERLDRLISRGPKRGLLTPREREVLVLIARGLKNSEIARELGLSPKTVATHRARLRAKLGLHTKAGLTRYALLKGLGLDSPVRRGGGDDHPRLR